MRIFGEAVRWVQGGDLGAHQVVLGGVIVANLAFVGASVMSYQ